MNFPFYIAKRYLVSKKKRNAINIISFISVLGVSVGTAALIIVLSVFNGFDSLLRTLYNSFDPDIKIESVEGKTFIPSNKLYAILENSDIIDNYSFCLEENAMLQYGDKQIIATIKGVDENYELVTGIDTMMRIGIYSLYYEEVPLAVSGQGIAYNLGVDFDFISPVSIYIPSRTREFRGNFQDATDNLNVAKVYVTGAFSVHQEYDTKYFLLPIAEVRKLLEYDKNISSVEIKLKSGVKNFDARKILEKELGKDFKILDRDLQHEYAYKIMKSEKWVIFMILILILLVASFNIIGSLTMLIIDKKIDITILKSLGADNKTIRNIFFLEGLFISFCGAIIGIIFGSFICWLQIELGLLKLGSGSGSFIIENYPVVMIWSDFIYVFIAVMMIGIFAAWFPVRYLMKRFV